jgi:1-acyl-sn-glycerol-3-phosphate acyltransferase
MINFIAYPLSVVYLACFSLTLLIFHPIQWFCFNVFGYAAHKKSVDYLNFFLVRCLHILGVRYTFNNSFKIPTNKPLIIVTNHQSMNDIPPIIWFMRKYHPKFISKKELGKGIPSVSYNLRHGGSVLIDRNQAIASIRAIEVFAKRVMDNNWAAVIFPEGTRSRDGQPKPFKTKGLMTLIEHIPNAIIVPITINNSWKTLKYGKFPLGIGAHIKFEVHKPIEVKGQDHKELITTIEKQISEAIKND